MQELRAFLAAEIAAGRGFYPPGAARLQRPPADAARRRPRRDPGPGSLPRPRARRWGSASRSRRASRRRRRSATSSPSSGPTSACPRPATGDLTPWAERGVLLLNSVLTVAPGLARLARRKGLGGVHRSRHRRALGAARGDRLPALGPLRAAEGSDRRHGAPPRAHRRSSVAVLGEQRLLRLPPLLARERAARGRRAATRSTGGSPAAELDPGQRAAVEQRPRDLARRAVADRLGTRASRVGGRETECASEAASATSPASSSAHAVRSAVAPCPPTSEGALRQSSQPRSTSGPHATRDRPRRRGSAPGARAPARAPPPRPRRRRRRRAAIGIVDLEPRAGELDQHGARAFEHELGRIAAGDLARVHLPAAPEVEAPARRPRRASLRATRRRARRARPFAGTCPRAHARAASRTGSRCRPRARAGRARAPPRSSAAPSSPEGTTWEWTSTKPGMLSTLAAARHRPAGLQRGDEARGCARPPARGSRATRRTRSAGGRLRGGRTRCRRAARRPPRRAAGRRARRPRAAARTRSGTRRTHRRARCSGRPGIAFSAGTRKSRRRRNSATIASTASCGPSSAATPGELRERRHARRRVDDQARQRVDELGRNGGVAEPPAGHRERLREAVEQDRALEHARAATRSTARRRRR